MPSLKGKGKFCNICKGNQENDYSHLATPLHKFNQLLRSWNEDRKGLVRNRHGIEVTITQGGHPLIHDVNNGKHSLKITPDKLIKQENKIEFRCAVTNRRSDSIYLTYANVLFPHAWFSFFDPNNKDLRKIDLKPGKTHAVIVRFETDNSVLIGSYNIPVCFSFETVGLKKDTFDIMRAINILLRDLTLPGENEDSESPFKGTAWLPGVEIYKPTSKPRTSNNHIIPKEYRKCLVHKLEEFKNMTGEDYAIVTELRQEMEPGNVTEYNYKKFWKTVLWLEEVRQEFDLQQYNMENVTVKLIGASQIELEVPGLTEKRPSVVTGDSVDIRLHDDHRAYRGIIKRVNETSIDVGDMDPEFFCIIERRNELIKELDIRFVLNRLTFERRHRGVNHIVENNRLQLLFPPEKVGYKLRPTTQRTINKFFNTNIAHNQEQKTAVLKILNGSSTPYPYIVFGPPGTGKTVTLVEAILQLKEQTTHNIFVCAPSNAACDVITEKLIERCDKKELIRIMSEHIDISTVHKVILPYTNYRGDDIFEKIVPEKLKTFRIVVTTLILAGRFIGKFSSDVLFIDEAAQACEAEACCALALVDKGNKIILAGDPNQLGPSLSSEVAKKYGLGVSLLERLMECDIYKRNDSNYITMLKQNFRNHHMILQLPNKLFYKNQLQAMSANSQVDPISRIFIFDKIRELQEKKGRKKSVGQPVEFCSLVAQETKEGQSPSFYNLDEAQMTLKYIQALLALRFDDADDAVRQTQIGIVTPYIRQVHKLKRLLQQHRLGDVEVGTTETFQGREKRIIIISTVRAKDDLLLEDNRYNLGFVKDDKRFNVALTRAMSKLIVIGCAHVLNTDEKWEEYIEFCRSLKGFCGAPYVQRNEDFINEVSKRIENIKPDTQYNHKNNTKKS